MDRRSFLENIARAGAALAVCPKVASAQLDQQASKLRVTRVVDSHIHLFDPTRSGGVPWPKPDDLIYKPALPPRYEEMVRDFDVVGAIAIEASPLPEDNDWLLKVVEDNPVMLGMIGDLVPGSAKYSQSLERLHRNPLFLGIRYGNLWDRNLAVDQHKTGFVDGLRELAKAHLVFETANPNVELMAAVLAVTAAVPELTIVIDHLPHAETPTDAIARKEWLAKLNELARSPNAFVKLSEIAPAATDPTHKPFGEHPERLDMLWDLFGPDRVIFGSDWPNSDHVASFADTFSLVKRYVTGKGPAASEKFFFRNSQKAYRWMPRTPHQALT